MLRNSFYTHTDVTTTTETLTTTIHFNPDHEIFQGHFPGQPVVPGVCMIQMIKEMMEEVAGANLLLKKGNQIKFLHLIVPDRTEAILVNISWKKEDQNYLTVADFKKGNDVLFKLNGIFTIIRRDSH